jgi:HJR/Mrr/RecB family endonuclease
MQHISGTSRQQLQISSLEDKIASDNPIRFIEVFVEHISLEALGFTVQTIKSEGRPSLIYYKKKRLDCLLKIHLIT